MKTCDICGTEFNGHFNAKRCSDACKKQGRDATVARGVARYQKTPKGKATLAKAQAKHRKTDKFKGTTAAYLQSDAGRQAQSKGQAKYQKTPKGKVVTHEASAKRRGAPSNGTLKHYREADQCFRCGRPGVTELEHMTPVARGGTNYIENLTSMCVECNRGVGGKHVKGPHDWPAFVCWFLRNENHPETEIKRWEIPRSNP